MQPTSPLPGIGLRLLATLLMTAMSAAVHAVADRVPVGQIIFWRSAVALLPICLYAALRGPFPAALRTGKPGAHVLRSLFGALSMALSFLSLAYLPVATAQGLAYLAPVLTLPFAALMLGERLRAGIVLPVLLGLAGVGLIFGAAMAMPGDGAAIGVAAALGYAVTMAFVRVHIKSMTDTESAAAIAFYFALTSILVGLATWPFGWVAPDGVTLLWLILAGLLGGFGHIAATEATARAQVSVLAAFDYTGLIWALGFDILLFGLWPDGAELVGAALILASALWVTRPAPATQEAGQDHPGRLAKPKLQREQPMGILLRWLGAFLLLAATFNPTRWNYVHWVRGNWADQMPLAVFLGLLLAVGYLVYIVATLRSIGAFGVVLIAAIFGAGLWVLIDWGVLSLTNPSFNLWLGILVLSLILGIGLSWSILRQRLSGQASVDEIEG